jgi:hypothetical protein
MASVQSAGSSLLSLLVGSWEDSKCSTYEVKRDATGLRVVKHRSSDGAVFEIRNAMFESSGKIFWGSRASATHVCKWEHWSDDKPSRLVWNLTAKGVAQLKESFTWSRQTMTETGQSRRRTPHSTRSGRTVWSALPLHTPTNYVPFQSSRNAQSVTRQRRSWNMTFQSALPDTSAVAAEQVEETHVATSDESDFQAWPLLSDDVKQVAPRKKSCSTPPGLTLENPIEEVAMDKVLEHVGQVLEPTLFAKSLWSSAKADSKNVVPDTQFSFEWENDLEHEVTSIVDKVSSYVLEDELVAAALNDQYFAWEENVRRSLEQMQRAAQWFPHLDVTLI